MTGDLPESVSAEAAGIAKSVAKYPIGDGSEADRLIAFARANFDLAVDEQNEAVAIPCQGPRIALGLSADHHGLGAALRSAAVDLFGRAPTQTTMAVVTATLEAYARRNPPRRVSLRVARPARDTLVIDLGRPDGVCVIVDPKGWRRAEGPPEPVVFRRTLLTLPVPEPEAGEDIAALRDLINVADADWPLLVVWMVAALMEDVPTPILLLTGEQGTGKSTAAKLLALLLDPSGAPLRSPPRTLEDWAVAAAGSWLVVLDNLSRIDERLMDALCRAVTGDALVRRALYTNSDVTVVAFRRKIALTTIDPGAMRGDLVERLLVIDLARITSTRRRTEAELMEAFEDLRPRLLGGLLDLVAKVLAVLPDVRVPEPPRMADFAHIAAAVDQVLGTRALELYITRSREITADVLDTDPELRPATWCSSDPSVG